MPANQKKASRDYDYRAVIIVASCAGAIAGGILAFSSFRVMLVTSGAMALAGIGFSGLVDWIHQKQFSYFLEKSAVWAFTFVVAACTVTWAGQAINFGLYRMPGRYLNWAAFLVLPAGYSAHQFKKRSQALYGLIEILVGVSTAFGSTARTSFGTPQGLAIIGAVYIVARGFNNFSESAKKES
jgi:hypothetical protein